MRAIQAEIKGYSSTAERGASTGVYIWYCVSIALAAILAWASRDAMNPDGLSYIDIASAALSGGVQKLVHPYWSPGYPALISAAFFFVRPTPAWEFSVVHAVNFLIFGFTLFAFSVFLRQWITPATGPVRSQSTQLVAWLTFLWFVLKWIGISDVTPDLALAGFIFLAAGIALRIQQGSGRIAYVQLGAALAAGYYTKAVMLPLAMALLAILFLLRRSSGFSRRGILASGFTLLLLSSPLIIALSLRLHRLTFGESGRLNYAWRVDQMLWDGGKEPPKPGTIPQHPAPKLMSHPVTLEFTPAVGGTYPLWYDPSYWYSGARPYFDLRKQLQALADAGRMLMAITLESAAIIAGIILFCAVFIQKERCQLWNANRPSSWLTIWSLAAIAVYSLVRAEPRYLGAFVVLFLLSLFPLVRNVDLMPVRRTIAVAFAPIFLLLAIVSTTDLASNAFRIFKEVKASARPEYQITAQSLARAGLHQGDKVAVVGYAYDCYYARYARLRVAAQIPNAKDFWSLSRTDAESLAARLESIGVKAIVAPRPSRDRVSNWSQRAADLSDRLFLVLLPTEPTTT